MADNSDEPDSPGPMPSPWARPADGTAVASAGGARHDGWTGERMAKFCEALADTGLVVEACLAAGKSTVGAYALRRRDPVFAAAWEAALTIARERLADSLLARSIEGSVEQYYKDGVLVGEKRVIDNRLGLAILRRLDRLAETGTPLGTGGARLPTGRVCPERSRGERSRGTHNQLMDWDLALAAMRSGEPAALAEALAMLRGQPAELNELNDPPNSLLTGDDDTDDQEPDDAAERCWQDDEDEDEKHWMTTYPPPDGFTGYQRGRWGDEDYERSCSREESALLDRNLEAGLSEYRAEDAALRDAWFARLAEQLAEPAANVHLDTE
jgi:hypothetical protein